MVTTPVWTAPYKFAHIQIFSLKSTSLVPSDQKEEDDEISLTACPASGNFKFLVCGELKSFGSPLLLVVPGRHAWDEAPETRHGISRCCSPLRRKDVCISEKDVYLRTHMAHVRKLGLGLSGHWNLR